MPNALNIGGQRFGRLVVVRRVASKAKRTLWECLCDCGSTTIVRTDHLIHSPRTESCGCLWRERTRESGISNIKHGHARGTKRHQIYKTWQGMNQRCSNPHNPKFPAYGGRGIKVCEAWVHSFAAFLADVGDRPSPGMSIDRINNDGNYEPGNVRWSDPTQQARNRRERKSENHQGAIQ